MAGLHEMHGFQAETRRGAEPAIKPALADPYLWGASFSGPPVVTSRSSKWKTQVCRWTGTDPNMPQPPLDHHVLVLHLGGDKRVQRSGGGVRRVFNVPEGGVTIIPAGCGFDWLTDGPVDFAHLYIPPDRLDRSLATVFDRDPSAFCLHDPVGVDDPLLRQLATTILGEVWACRAPHAYLDSLFEAVLSTLIQQYSNLKEMQGLARHALAPARLRRVLGHIETALFGPIDLEELAQVVGLSRFHFSRAFRRAVGQPPLAYVARRRLEVAKNLLRTTSLPIAEIAARTGFNSASYFCVAFQRAFGRSPRDYRYDEG
jgi:AraC family transcriptional regulator